jgi:TonB family protein
MKTAGFPFLFLIPILLLIQNTGTSQSFTPATSYSESKLLQDFLCSEVVYPEHALNEGIEGKVVILFKVEKDGSVSQVVLKEKVSPELDSEAVRLFSMLLWEPAISMGQPVVSENEFPIDFNIKKYKKHCKTRGYEKTDYPFMPIDTSNQVYETSGTDRKPYPIFDEKGMSVNKFIAQNIHYPETAFRQGISGKVSLRFVVEPHGRVSNVKVVTPVGGGCSQEAVRLLLLLKWMPGIKNQMAVRTFMNLDIEFKLPENSDMNMFENSQMNN